MESSISQFRGIVCMDVHSHREPGILLGNSVIRLPERNGGILAQPGTLQPLQPVGQIRDRTLLSFEGGRST